MEALGSGPHVVALLEVPHPFSGMVCLGYWSMGELCTILADGMQGQYVVIMLKDGVTCFGSVVE